MELQFNKYCAEWIYQTGWTSLTILSPEANKLQIGKVSLILFFFAVNLGHFNPGEGVDD